VSNKSEATWHPNGGPEVPHADLIADLRGLAELLTGLANRATLRRAADALAALGDTVPREQYDLQLGNHADDSRRHLTRARSAERERDEARAERDAILYASTAESDLALHDAEVKAQALDEAAEAFATGEWSDAFATEYVEDDVSAVQATEAWLTARSAAIREESKND
jgi:hypothetical protein